MKKKIDKQPKLKRPTWPDELLQLPPFPKHELLEELRLFAEELGKKSSSLLGATLKQEFDFWVDEDDFHIPEARFTFDLIDRLDPYTSGKTFFQVYVFGKEIKIGSVLIRTKEQLYQFLHDFLSKSINRNKVFAFLQAIQEYQTKERFRKEELIEEGLELHRRTKQEDQKKKHAN